MRRNPEEDYRGITMKPILGGRGWIAEHGDWSQVRTTRQELKQDIDRVLRSVPRETPFPGTEGLAVADNPRSFHRFPVGTRVKNTMGVRQSGVVIPPFAGPFTDGSYRLPHSLREAKEAVYVRWDDGTKGWIHAPLLTIEADNPRPKPDDVLATYMSCGLKATVFHMPGMPGWYGYEIRDMNTGDQMDYFHDEGLSNVKGLAQQALDKVCGPDEPIRHRQGRSESFRQQYDNPKAPRRSIFEGSDALLRFAFGKDATEAGQWIMSNLSYGTMRMALYAKEHPKLSAAQAIINLAKEHGWKGPGATENPKAMTPRSFIASARHSLERGDPESATVYAQAALDTAKESGDHIGAGIAKMVMKRIEREGGRGPMSTVYDNPVPRAVLYKGHRIVKRGLHWVIYPEDDDTPIGQADFPSLESAKQFIDTGGRVFDNPKLDRGGERAEYYHVRITDPKKFKEYRTVEFSRKQGILAVMGLDRRKRGPRGGVSHIQALRFAKDMWSPSEIDSWLRKHGYGKLRKDA